MSFRKSPTLSTKVVRKLRGREIEEYNQIDVSTMSTIFLVEDDQYISRVYERAFRLGGHEVEIMEDGESAWTKLSAMDPLPSAIILDIILPKMSGTDLLAKIDGDRRFDHTPIAVLTNSFNQDLEKKLLAAGADLYLIKIDHEPKDVVAKIEDLIRKIH